MFGLWERQQRALNAFQQAVQQCVRFFATVDPDLYDGYQTAHDALVGLVYWQCEHLAVLNALLEDEQPALKDGTFAALRRAACQCQSDTSMDDLLRQFQAQAEELAGQLQRLPDWTMNFPIKKGGRPSTVEDRVFAIAASMDNQVAILRRAAVSQQPPRSEPEIWDDRQLQLLN